MKICVINGPNLNLVGVREPEVYGHQSLTEYLDKLKIELQLDGIQLSYFQSNIEGELVTQIQKVGFEVDGIILNAGAYTHTSIAIADAVAAITTPVIEVHISNIMARETERHTSLLSKYAKGMISGLGLAGYELAINFFKLKKPL